MKKDRFGDRKELKVIKKNRRLQVSEPVELMIFLIEKMPDKSRNNIKSILARGQVLVNGKVVKQYNHPLLVGQEVIIDLSPPSEKEEDDIPNIIYEDNDLIVIDKPAGLLTISTDSEKEHTAYHQLMNYVRKKNIENRIFIVHRLDRDTSGVLVFAKNEELKNLFQNGWKEIMVERTYVAVVEGQVRKKEDTIKSWLLETKTKLIYSSNKPGDGLEAITHYKVLQDTANYSLLEIHLETGRKNQIRVQLQDIGHSIIGDKKYSSKVNPIGRLALHARVLSFHHPVTQKLMRFETEIPPNFSMLFK
ncbi:MAG: RluA family pseudouridine synthase [Vulcanibacillus sp.]